MENFSQKLKVLIKKKQLTQPKLSSLLGIPIDTLRSWLYGKRLPSDYAQSYVISKINELDRMQGDNHE